MQKSLTSLLSAFARAYHAEHAKRPVFSDGVAKLLFSEKEYGEISDYLLRGAAFFFPDEPPSPPEERLRRIVNDQFAPTPVCRAACCERELRRAENTKQYVILGAGLDTFAFRSNRPLAVYEIDRPETQRDKLARVARANLPLPESARFLEADFTRENFAEKLLRDGFDPALPSFFSLLGVSYYLGKEDLKRNFSAIASLLSADGFLFFDYADENLFSAEERRVRNMTAMAQAGGEPMVACYPLNEIERILAESGLIPIRRYTPERIGRELLKNAEMTAFEHIHYILAKRAQPTAG